MNSLLTRFSHKRLVAVQAVQWQQLKWTAIFTNFFSSFTHFQTLLAISDFAGGAVLQAVSECSYRRNTGTFVFFMCTTKISYCFLPLVLKRHAKSSSILIQPIAAPEYYGAVLLLRHTISASSGPPPPL